MDKQQKEVRAFYTILGFIFGFASATILYMSTVNHLVGMVINK